MSNIIFTDPICGMVLKPQAAAATFTYAGWTYLFCCEECLQTFKKAPDDCILYLAHSQSGCLGYVCQRQRNAWDQTHKGAFR